MNAPSRNPLHFVMARFASIWVSVVKDFPECENEATHIVPCAPIPGCSLASLLARRENLSTHSTGSSMDASEGSPN